MTSIRRRSRVLVAVVVLFLAVGGGVVGAVSADRERAPERYVQAVCRAFGDWLATTNVFDREVIDLVGRAGSGDLEPTTAKRRAVRAIDGSVDASRRLVGRLRRAGTPDVVGGHTIARHEREIGASVAGIYAAVRKDFAGLATQDPAEFVAGADTVIQAAAAGFSAASDPLLPMQSDPVLRAAVAAETECPASSASVTPGVCLLAPEGLDPSDIGLGDFASTDCAAPHHAEVIAVTEYPADAGAKWPGDDVITSYADRTCRDAFLSYVGIAYADSTLDARRFPPTVDTWDDGDREIVCLVQGPDGSLLTGSRQATGS